MTVKGVARLITGVVVACFVVACFVVAVSGRTARAHPELSALGTNRYVTVALFDGRVDVSDVLLEGTLASSEERRGLDGDGNGTIDAAEVRAAEARLAGEGPAFEVELDGQGLVTGGGAFAVGVELGGEPLAESAPVVIERRLSLTGAWTAGIHRLRVRILREPARLLDTEIGVVVGPGLVLRDGPERVTFRGPRASVLEARAGVFTFEAPSRPRPRGRRGALGAGGAVALALALGAAWRWARRRRSRAG